MDETIDLSALWDAVREELTGKTPSVSLQQSRLAAIVGDTALLEVPDPSVRDLIESFLYPAVAAALSRRLDRPVKVAVTVRAAEEGARPSAKDDFRGTILGDQRLTVGQDNRLSVEGNNNLTVGGDANTSVRGSSHLDAGEVVIQATHRIALEVGQHRLRLDESGLTIELGGGTLTITGAERVDLSGDVITAQGSTLSLTASGEAAFGGSPLKLN